MPGRPLRSELKAITPPPLPLSGGRGVKIGVAVGGTGVAVGVGVGVGGIGVAVGTGVSVGGYGVAVGGASVTVGSTGSTEGSAVAQPPARSAKINPPMTNE
jgi:hypothetical protein